MLYFWLKLIHILSSSILFGTGLGTACVMLYGHHSQNIQVRAAINRYVVLVDWVCTGSTMIIQPLTGLWIVFLLGYSLHAFWLWASLIAYGIILSCWIVVVLLQIKISNLTNTAEKTHTELSPYYSIYLKWWFILGWPALLCMLFIFYCMVMKPN